jgi:hypothetical protein
MVPDFSPRTLDPAAKGLPQRKGKSELSLEALNLRLVDISCNGGLASNSSPITLELYISVVLRRWYRASWSRRRPNIDSLQLQSEEIPANPQPDDYKVSCDARKVEHKQSTWLRTRALHPTSPPAPTPSSLQSHHSPRAQITFPPKSREQQLSRMEETTQAHLAAHVGARCQRYPSPEHRLQGKSRQLEVVVWERRNVLAAGDESQACSFSLSQTHHCHKDTRGRRMAIDCESRRRLLSTGTLMFSYTSKCRTDSELNFSTSLDHAGLLNACQFYPASSPSFGGQLRGSCSSCHMLIRDRVVAVGKRDMRKHRYCRGTFQLARPICWQLSCA